jgi:hypothetical protein
MHFRSVTEQMHADVKYAGGFTWSPLHSTPLSGYMVGFKPIAIIPADDVLSNAVLADAIKMVKETDLHLFIGGWLDNNTAYYDISQHIPDRDIALETARLRGELAIFDLSTTQEIRVDMHEEAVAC